ncbi:hypothetical protein AVEN_200713-1 [Araneus ventricosus]|uniref:Uncharacterized protein n=2 Tax=Araneus ventricosus TaxID=182803 RepID=A0A4Y2KKU8_ARAVE|nr:hypothetical protein AVEN_4689-1 [Araneus ventricosus]GBN02968.1 hypothetical protein AVEN_39981-1 [Araneus ventricosus]GBN02997.1 hypothetical protein AVEN_200713-1 [Araneus ventricosus]
MGTSKRRKNQKNYLTFCELMRSILYFNILNAHIWGTSNPLECTTKPPHLSQVTVWCGFSASFIVCAFFIEERCPISGWKICIVTGERYFTILGELVGPALRERDVLSTVSVSCPSNRFGCSNSIRYDDMGRRSGNSNLHAG